ncbi:MAG TPA: peptidoglycan DD-metalloendopeptidase family protein [Gaiellaceae bacterium]|jgi:murein DD-endopeptidase MepM/ murein hydrolase activator NlpD|nr:peptidoglycan DD-metalloendopeptidase family protein [Gaiellaceae bacterium]
MRARLLIPLVLVLLAVLAAPASGDVSSRKQAIDTRLERVQAKLAWAERRERELAGEITSVNQEIRGLASQVGAVSTRLEPLERDLDLHRQKLDHLNELFRLQTGRYELYRHEYEALMAQLGNRLVDLYEGGDPSTLEVLLGSKSVGDLITKAQLVDSIGIQDKKISEEVGSAKERVRVQRAHTKRFRSLVAAETRTIAIRAGQVRALRDQLLASRDRLAAARSAKRESLQNVKESKAEYLHEVAGLQAASAALAGQIRTAQSTSSYSPGDATPSAAGFIWPVNGPVTSPFGWRWGRMHEGIDIGAAYGTPIHAAASGRVIYAGWMSGYGNLVAIDHGRGISTAYGHQSSIAVSNGQIVSQGQTIGYVGCTGHCFGPHLHFEVRINGSPVDPLGYL